MICRIVGHVPVELLDGRTGETVVQCKRCGLGQEEWRRPLVGARMRTVLWTGTWGAVAAVAAARLTGTTWEEAILTGVSVAAAGYMARYQESGRG